MKILPYLLGVSIITSGIDLIFTTNNLYGCPRCRRALPKGPRKLPHPGFSKKNEKPTNNAKESATKPSGSCSSSCCCKQQKTS